MQCAVKDLEICPLSEPMSDIKKKLRQFQESGYGHWIDIYSPMMRYYIQVLGEMDKVLGEMMPYAIYANLYANQNISYKQI